MLVQGEPPTRPAPPPQGPEPKRQKLAGGWAAEADAPVADDATKGNGGASLSQILDGDVITLVASYLPLRSRSSLACASSEFSAALSKDARVWITGVEDLEAKRLKRFARWLVWRLGRSSEWIISCLEGCDHPFVRAEGLLALGKKNIKHPRAEALLRSALKDADASVRLGAVRAIASMDEGAEAYISAVVEQLGGGEEAAGSGRGIAAARGDIDMKRVVVEILSAACPATCASLLQHASWKARLSALTALKDMPPSQAAPHVAAIAARLKDANRFVRGAAVLGLGRLRHLAEPFVAEMVERLGDADYTVRLDAAHALGTIHELVVPHVDQLEAFLAHPDAGVRRVVLKVMARVEVGSQGTRGAVARRLSDADDDVREAALLALSRLKDQAAPYAAEIATRLDDSHMAVRCAAISALGGLGPAGATPYAAQIARCLRDEHYLVRRHAIKALGSLPDHAAAFAPEVARLLDDDSNLVRMAAIRALKEIGKGACVAAAALIVPMLSDKSESLRSVALDVVGSMGPLAAEHLPLVAPLLEDESDMVRATAVRVMGALGAEGHARAIAARLEDGESRVRSGALTVLRGLWPRLPSDQYPMIGSEVAGLLDDEDRGVRHLAAKALASMGEAAGGHVLPRESYTKLAHALDDECEHVRAAAAAALGALGATSAPVLAALAASLKDESLFVRQSALDALLQAGPAASSHADAIRAAGVGGWDPSLVAMDGMSAKMDELIAEVDHCDSLIQLAAGHWGGRAVQ